MNPLFIIHEGIQVECQDNIPYSSSIKGYL